MGQTALFAAAGWQSNDKDGARIASVRLTSSQCVAAIARSPCGSEERVSAKVPSLLYGSA